LNLHVTHISFMKTVPCILLTLAVAAGSLCAHAEQPTTQVRSSTDRILALLGDAALKADDRKSERRQLVRRELDRRIDWATIARSSLGHHWSKLTPSQRTEFTDLFSRLLEQTYVSNFETYYRDLDKIEYLGEKIVEEYASVKVRITTKDALIHPVEYRLQQSGQDWRVYDVLIEGVSLVKNYRDQFDEILAKSSYEKLATDIRAKLTEASP